jgi:fructose-bisphosphate aldolase class 1
MATTTLEWTAPALVVPGKGILAADECHLTVGRRLAPGEQVTEGPDGLRERMADYRKLGNSATRAGAYTIELERSAR